MKDAKEWITLLDHQKKALEEYELKLGKGLYIATDIKKEESKEEK